MFSRLFHKDTGDLSLTEEELQLRRQRQKRIAIIAASILVLLLVGYLSARPVLNAVRAWQARRHAQKAYALIDQEKWGDARTEAIAAYQLRSTEPEAIRAVARLLSRAGQPDGLKFWAELEAKTKLTRTDLRDQAGVALKTREFHVADNAIKELLGTREGGPTPVDWLLAADLALQEQDPDRATVYVRNVFASNSASDREVFKATLLLDRILLGKEGKDRTETLERFIRLARGKESVAVDALVMLAQNVLGSTAPWASPAGMSLDDIIQGLETHPLAKPQHKLLAVDLKIHEHPDQRDALLQDAITQYKGGDNATLLALAAWLNTRGEYQRELDTIPRQRAMQTRELFFQHVDALGALGRWDEIRRLIESEQFPLDPVVEHMYLARCFAQQNQSAGAENNWTRALQAAAGDLGKLMILSDYAEKNGAYDVAGAAFEAAVAVAPKSRPAQQGRLRVAYATRDTKKIHAILLDLLKLWPNDPAVQNDEAYARLLLLPSLPSTASSEPSPSAESSTTQQLPPGRRPLWAGGNNSTSAEPSTSPELKSIEALAEKLLQREPASLPHRTVLALARLKQNRPADALLVYKDINVPKSAVTTSAMTVHAAVLAAAGHKEEARTEFSHLPVDKLLPEERALIEGSGD
jgi:tetratricopeptide (TPR) repeat protein